MAQKRIGLEPFGPVIYEVIISFSRLPRGDSNSKPCRYTYP